MGTHDPSSLSGYTRLTASGMIMSGPMALHGLVVKASAANAQTTVYDAQNEDANAIVIIVEGPANQSTPIDFSRPPLLSRGCYVNLGSNVEEVLVLWEPTGPAR